MHNIIIIIPAYNEEKTIKNVIEKIPKFVKTTIVMDDGSTDRTAEIAKKAGAVVITNKQNMGLGANFFKGIQEAIKLKPDVIVNMDADGQFNPEDIPTLIKPILDGKADMVTATRHPFTGVPPLKIMGNTVLTKMVNFLSRKKFTDTQCGFRAYSREAAQSLNLFSKYTYTQEVFFDLINKGFKIQEIPLNIKPEREGTTRLAKSLKSYAAKVLLIFLKTCRDLYPLKFFGIPGLFLSFIGFGMLLYLGMGHYFFGNDLDNHLPFLILSTITSLLGVLLVLLALVADMFERVNKTQERILFEIKEGKYG